MTDPTDTGDDGTNSLERIVDGLLAAEAARELKEAVDLEAILADQPADEPVDVDRLADALGRPIGRLLAHRIVDASGVTGFAKRKVVTDAGDRVATKAIEVTAGAADLGTDQTTDSGTTGGTFGSESFGSGTFGGGDPGTDE